MTTYAFVNVPAYGHVNPTLPVAQELVARGEKVIYYLTEDFRDAVEATGALFRPYQFSFGDMKPPTSFSGNDLTRNAANIMPVRMVSESAVILPQIIEDVKAERPDYIVYDMMCLFGKILARSLHIPAILLRPSYAANDQFTMMQQPGARPAGAMGSPLPSGSMGSSTSGNRQNFASFFDERFAQVDKQLQALCQQYGVEPFSLREMFADSEPLTIVFIPREFQPRAETFDTHQFVFVGPSLAPRSSTTNFPLEKLTNQTVLLISLGTVFNNQAAFFNMCFTAFQDKPWFVVLSRGKYVDPAALDPIPANFLVEPYVPQLEILQRASAFITHAGMNSTMESLYYGVPMVAIPQMPEQAMTGQHIDELGLGILLEREAVTAESLRLAVERIMDDPSFRERVSRMQRSVHNAGGYKKAADAIITFAAGSPN